MFNGWGKKCGLLFLVAVFFFFSYACGREGIFKASFSKTWKALDLAFKSMGFTQNKTETKVEEGVLVSDTLEITPETLKVWMANYDTVSAWTKGKCVLSVKAKKEGKVKTRISAILYIESFGRPHYAMMRPDWWYEQKSNGRCEERFLAEVKKKLK